ncbi:hypothetical protein, partial [Sphingobium estronivorans]|uniref:hypothetical protein n=1 Tax=Sphingobium estronivorans TaxID=1577690 RepID=UPI0013C34487
MRYRLYAALGAASFSLSACGGGGDQVNSTPPAPTNATLVDLQYSQTFSARGAEINYSVAPNGSATPPTSSGGILAGSDYGTEIRYDASSKSYTVKTVGPSNASMQFTEADRVAAQSNAAITVYEKKSGATIDNLVLSNPGSGNPTRALTYTSYGAWQRIAQGTSGLDVRTVFLSYGLKTAASDMPRTGAASYQTTIDGQFADASGVYAVSGNSSFGADFGAGTVNFSMTPVGQHVLNGTKLYFGTLDGTGTIDFSASSFSANHCPPSAPMA